MKKNFTIIIPLCLIFFLFNLAYSGDFKWLRVGRYQTKVVDSGDQGESSGEGTFSYSYYDNFTRSGIDHAGWQLGSKDWYDEGGKYWPVKISGAGHGTCDESMNTIPIPDDEGITIRKYVRTQPPPIYVDGYRLDEPFPLTESDAVAPEKIPGTADIMVESTINTSMGITITQKVLGWSQTNHDTYLIFDWTFTNTGNVDIDSDIELPNQTLKDVYFLRAINFRAAGASRDWRSCYGEYPTDTLRMIYAYPQRNSTTYDNLGDPRTNGWTRRPHYQGEVYPHVDKSVSDHTDDPSQPQMTGVETAELLWIKNESNINSPSDHLLLYRVMQEGFLFWDGTPEMVGTYPNTHHGLRMDEQGMKFVTDFPWYVWRPCSYTSSGPYTLEPGDSFRIVWGQVEHFISPRVGWDIGLRWRDKVDIEPPPGCVFGVTDNMPPQYKVYPELYATDSRSSEYNNWARDCWIFTGKDSLFAAAWNCQWNVQNNYDIPTAPPAPSLEINSRPDRIEVSWGNESETASDFAGYRIYRGIMTSDSTFFYPIFEVTGKGTHSYEDATAQRGIGYVYYVTAFDDGIANKVDAHGRKESLESGRFLNQTKKPAYLTRPAGTLSTARVVPNPYNYGARDIQYIGEPDKIMFLDIPGYCTIKIYTESGDLIKTLYHTTGSGDEPWGVSTLEHSTTDTGQLIVSGIYIALIEENNEDGTPTGNQQFLKFVVVR